MVFYKLPFTLIFLLFKDRFLSPFNSDVLQDSSRSDRYVDCHAIDHIGRSFHVYDEQRMSGIYNHVLNICRNSRVTEGGHIIMIVP